MAEDSTSPDIAGLIRASALANGVDPAVLARIAQVESGMNPAAANPRSTAKGLFQFIDSTWRTHGQGDPLDPNASAEAGARFTAANTRGLRGAGIEPTPAATYLAHFAGLGGATKLLSGDPSVPAVDVLGAAAVRANPWMAGMSVGDVRAWAAKKMGGAGAGAVPAATGQQVAPASTATGGAPVAAAGPSQTGAVPVAAENAAGGEDELLRTLQMLSAPDAAQQQQMPAPPPLTINFPHPPGLQRARALALAMGKERIA